MFAQNGGRGDGGFRYELDAFVRRLFTLEFRHGCCSLLVPPVLAECKDGAELLTTSIVNSNEGGHRIVRSNTA